MDTNRTDPLRAWLDDTAPERFTLHAEGKALAVSPLQRGDLLVEGIAAVWDVDRQGEAFDPSAFDEAITTFLNGTAPLLLQHVKNGRQLGRVLTLAAKPDGLHMTARVDGVLKSDPQYASVYEQIRRGSLNGVSVGGFFTRKGGKIVRADLTEISLTPVPVGGHKATVSVVSEGKALTGQDHERAARRRILDDAIEAAEREIYRARLRELAR